MQRWARRHGGAQASFARGRGLAASGPDLARDHGLARGDRDRRAAGRAPSEDRARLGHAAAQEVGLPRPVLLLPLLLLLLLLLLPLLFVLLLPWPRWEGRRHRRSRPGGIEFGRV